MVNENLLHIALEYFQIGATTKDDIFIKQNNDYVLLLAKNMPVTNRMYETMERLKYTDRNVYVRCDYYKELIKNEVPGILCQQHLEEEIGYAKIKKDSSGFLLSVEKNGVVETVEAERISNDIAEKVKNVDAALLLQCINGKNNNVDEYFITHCTNVSLLNGLIGKWLGLSDDDIHTLTLGGLLHDVGKTKIPSDVLNAPRKLTKEEFELVKSHAVFSYDMLKKDPTISDEVAEIARWHHEKINGQGYPDGLHCDDIPLFARITAVSDVYDALVSKRCYKEAVTPFEILHLLDLNKFSDLDYELVWVLVNNLPNELIGKTVFLSNGTIGTVKFVNRHSLKYPLVDVQGEIIQTSKDLYCVTMIQ